MKLEQARWLLKVAEEKSLDGFEIHRSYSGRAMYGKTTTGIDCPSMSLFCDLLFAAMTILLTHSREDIEGWYETPDDLFSDTQNIQTDQMGRGVIVY